MQQSITHKDDLFLPVAKVTGHSSKGPPKGTEPGGAPSPVEAPPQPRWPRHRPTRQPALALPSGVTWFPGKKCPQIWGVLTWTSFPAILAITLNYTVSSWMLSVGYLFKYVGPFFWSSCEGTGNGSQTVLSFCL